jgi:hypothetical protein
MSWYKHAMTSIADLQPIVGQLCSDIGAISGVDAVYLWGSYNKNHQQPAYVVKDIDIIACTNFDSGDLLAIDNGKYSALRMHTNDLLDEGFNPQAVSFTKKYLSFEKYNVDHWATAKDGKLLHWGAIADSQEEWADLHNEAEKRATEMTGLSRGALYKACSEQRKDWREIYDSQINLHLSRRNIGWCESSHHFDEIILSARKM